MDGQSNWRVWAAALACAVVLGACGGGGGATTPAPPPQPVAQPPAIGTQPQAAVVDDGTAAAFSVAATGTAPLAYQWQKNGVAIAGATAAAYTTGELGLADDQGRYSVAISNAAGAVNSAVATVTVKPAAPRIVSVAQPLTAKDGAAFTLTVSAKGSAPLAYQWQKNGMAIAGANAAQLDLTAQMADNGAQFSVVVSNAQGTATSGAYALQVDPRAAVFTLQPADLSVATGASLVLTAEASGTPPLSLQWQRSDDGGFTWLDIAGAQAARLNLGAATLDASHASYRLSATNAAGSVPSQAARISVTPTVRVLAGALGGMGLADGTGRRARFNLDNGLALDAQGHAIVADAGNRALRKVTPAGVVSTWVGPEGGWNFPSSVALDGLGNAYVGDGWRIFKVGPDGKSVLWAGASEPVFGMQDGTGSAATFGNIQAITSDAAGNLAVVDSQFNALRLVSSTGVVSTLAGGSTQSGQLDGQGKAARFQFPLSVTRDAAGNFFVADGTAIRKVTPSGQVSVHACSLNGPPTYQGLLDGQRLSARCYSPRGLAFDPAGNLYFGDLYAVRRIDTQGMLSTIAGAGHANGSIDDGTGAAAIVNAPNGMVWSAAANAMLFVEPQLGIVRTVTGGGVVKTIAGLAATTGLVNAQGSSARFAYPGALLSAPNGTVYVLDTANRLVRRLATDGRVTTFGSGLPLLVPEGLALDAAGNLFVTDRGQHVVVRITPAGSMAVYAGKLGEAGRTDGTAGAARFNAPSGIAIDEAGSLWVSDAGNHTLRRISAAGVVSTAAGTPGQCGMAQGGPGVGQLCNPGSLVSDRAGGLLVADGSATIRRVASDGTLSAFVGVPGSPGVGDGLVARFSPPLQLATDKAGNLYVADSGNSLVRKVTPAGVTSTVIGQPGVAALATGAGGSINAPRGIAVTAAGRLLFTSEQAIVGD